MTDRPPLTLADIERHQFAKGQRKYGVSLAAAGLPVSALALHALEELVDLAAYLDAMPGGAADFLPVYDALAMRLLPIADHPKPLPPDVPTPEAVALHGRYWQLGNRVVRVRVDGSGVRWQSGIALLPVDPTDPRWRGPITLRPNLKETP